MMCQRHPGYDVIKIPSTLLKGLQDLFSYLHCFDSLKSALSGLTELLA